MCIVLISYLSLLIKENVTKCCCELFYQAEFGTRSDSVNPKVRMFVEGSAMPVTVTGTVSWSVPFLF